MLLHVVFAREGFVALWAKGILFASVLLGMACSVTGCREIILAIKLLG
jgi:hypothetical protein